MPLPNISDAVDPHAPDYETLERRYTIAVNLECWELLAMHSIANDESIPRMRLSMMKAFAGIPTSDRNGGGSGGGQASPSTSRRRVSRDAIPRHP